MVTVAIDEGPLHGRRTGIGNAVDWTIDALRRSERPLELLPYVTSMRAHVDAPTRRLPIPAMLAHRWWARFSFPRADRWLGRPDLVHGTNYVVPPTSCPRIVSVYDCWFLDHPGDAAPDVRRAGEVLRRSVADGAHVVTSSDATAERVRDLLDTERVETVHLGPPHPGPEVAQAPGRLRPIENESFVLALGTVERRKNLPVLVAAFGRLASELDGVALVIAGAPGDGDAAIDAAVGRLPAASSARITRLGRVDEAEKSWLLRSARVLAYPSLDEGFGFPLLEAQLAGTPIVASSAGSIPEVAGRGALFSSPHDVDALAANLHWTLTSDRRADSLIEQGRANVERFSWDRTAASLVDLYERVAATS